MKKTETEGVPTEQIGRQLIPCDFAAHNGRMMRDIIDPLGRVFEPNPYDIPQWRYRVLHFCAHFMRMMVDTGEIDGGGSSTFCTKEDLYKFRELLIDVLNRASCDKDRVQKDTPAPWDYNIQLLKPNQVRKHGRKFDPTPCLKQGWGRKYFDHKKLNISRANRLVVVIKALQMYFPRGEKNKGTSWTLAFDATSGRAAEILTQEVSGNGYYETEYFLVPKKMLAKPSMHEHKLPQFLGS